MNPSRAFVIESLESRQLMATIAVLNTTDSGAGSLRDAITSATAGDTIDLSGVTGTITLQSTLVIDKTLTIQGPRLGSLTLDGNNAVQIFDLSAPSISEITIADLSLTHGTAPSGGAMAIDNTDNVTLTRCTFSDNVATGAGGSSISSGGAIYMNAGDLTITDSTFINNSAINASYDSMGGAIGGGGGEVTVSGSTFSGNTASGMDALGGAISSYTEIFVTNTTFSGNIATASSGYALGGAIDSEDGFILSNCTVVNNSAIASNSGGGGLWDDSLGYGPTLGNCIVAMNSATYGADVTAYRTEVHGNYNLIGSNDGNQFINGNDGNQVGTTSSPFDPMLNALASNGGPTQTMSLKPGSPAINGGDNNAGPTTDQRGYARIDLSDIGAFEYNGVAPTPPETTGITFADGVVTIAGRSTGDDIHAWTREGGQFRIVFDGSTKNYDAATITNVVINGNDGDDTVLVNTGNISARVFGGAGNDTLLGGDEADTLVGGDGNDYLSSAAGNDALYGEAGNDNLFGGDGDDLLFGGDGNDTLRGEGGTDILRGEAGANAIFAKNGTADIIRSASLLDTFKMDSTLDKLFIVAT